MRHALGIATIVAASVMLATTARAQGAKPLTKCAPDAVLAGTVCVDKYEASVWQVADPTGVDAGLVKKIRSGKVTLADLQAAGATQQGISSDNYGSFCNDDGSNCLLSQHDYAVSLPGVTPSAWMTWFQANAFCANSRKRLPTNAEWQIAGTGDGGAANANCNNLSGIVAATGASAGCVSEVGAYDTTGNLDEWVADWVPLSKNVSCTTWSGIGSGDAMCLVGAIEPASAPGALLRGGNTFAGNFSGPLSVDGSVVAYAVSNGIGFRCVR